MATTQTPDEFMHLLREQRSSEANFNSIQEALDQVIGTMKDQQPTMATALSDAKEKYATAYLKAKETGGSAWPEFEKFISELEKTLTQEPA